MAGVQVISTILPQRVNVRRRSSWYAKAGEPEDMSPEDTQVSLPHISSACRGFLSTRTRQAACSCSD